MKLPIPFIQLPLQFDASLLAYKIAPFGTGIGASTRRSSLATSGFP
jgi:hypothetical protein